MGMNTSRRRFLRTTAAVAATGAMIPSAHAADPVRIGVITDLSGPSSGDTGMAAVYAAQFAVQDFGPKVLGRDIEVVVADDQGKPDVGLSIVRQWLDQQGVATVIGNTISSEGIGIKRLCEDRKRPFLVGTSASSVFTQEECSPFTVVFGVNTYSMPKGVVAALLAKGLDTWFFITADYAFGHTLEADSSAFVRNNGGKIVGSVRSPQATADYSSFLLQAQASGAKVIGLAVQGFDFENLVKQAREFGFGQPGRQTLAGLFVLENQVAGAGLDNAGGMVASGAFYWDMNDATRAYARRLMARTGGVPPNGVQVAPYSAALHFLRGVQAAGTTDGAEVVAAMKRLPIDDFWSKGVQVREDGQALRPMYLFRIKTPAESRSKYDLYTTEGEVPSGQAWRPLAESVCPFIRKGLR